MWWRNPFLLAVGVVVALGAAFAGGVIVSDDSAEVNSLRSDLAEIEQDYETAGEELAEANDDRDLLTAKLKAERSIQGDLPETDRSVGVAADSDYVLGEAGVVGPTVMRPTVLEEAGTAGGGIKYLLDIEVKNDGKEPINPFCGEEATIIDASGRTYSGESVLSFNSPNCGDDIQPGLTKSGYTMSFTLPKDAEPAVIELVYDIFAEDEPVSWAVK